MTARTMILLVSDQPMPNLLAAAHPPLDVREVILVESHQMAEQAERLERVLASRGIVVRRRCLDDAYDPEPCRKLVHEVVGDAPGQFIVNVTGGTKVMAMGAYLAAVEREVRDILYLEHAQGKARWLSSGLQRDNRPEFVLEAKLVLDEVLAVHGFEPAGDQVPTDREVGFALQLASKASKEAIFALNRLTQAALAVKPGLRKKKPVTVDVETLKGKKSTDDELNEAQAWLVEARKAGLCDFDQKSVTFRRSTPCKLVGGSWLELAAWDAMRRIAQRCGLSGLKIGVTLKGRDDIENEIDVLALAGRTPFVIECKTARLSGGDTEVKADAIFYKLDHLRRLGGLKTQLAFVSLDLVPKGQRKRFEEREIHVIDGEEIRDLEGALARWIGNGVTA